MVVWSVDFIKETNFNITYRIRETTYRNSTKSDQKHEFTKMNNDHKAFFMSIFIKIATSIPIPIVFDLRGVGAIAQSL